MKDSIFKSIKRYDLENIITNDDVMKSSVFVSLDDDINNSTYAPYGHTKFDALNVDNRRNEKYDYFYIKTRYKDNSPISEDNNDANIACILDTDLEFMYAYGEIKSSYNPTYGDMFEIVAHDDYTFYIVFANNNPEVSIFSSVFDLIQQIDDDETFNITLYDLGFLTSDSVRKNCFIANKDGDTVRLVRPALADGKLRDAKVNNTDCKFEFTGVDHSKYERYQLAEFDTIAEVYAAIDEIHKQYKVETGDLYHILDREGNKFNILFVPYEKYNDQDI